MKSIILSLLLVSCGGGQPAAKSNQQTAPTPEQQEIAQLQQSVLGLTGTSSQLSAFVSSPYTTCAGTLTQFQQNICSIAQSAVAEQDTTFFDSLSSVSKTYQNQLYGGDCTSTTQSGCPLAGSVTAQLAVVTSAEANDAGSLTAINTTLTTLQGSVTSLQTSVSAITLRLNNFNGSGTSLENVVTGINGTLTSLQNQINSINTTLSASNIWTVIQVCGNNAASGPLFEAMLESGDKKQVDAYVVSGSLYGLGVIETAGVTGTQYLKTTLNTTACNFKIYDLTTSVKVCWDKSTAAQTSAGIDTACNYPSFASPTANCTCK